jgi:hypothetical protein
MDYINLDDYGEIDFLSRRESYKNLNTEETLGESRKKSNLIEG